MLTIILTFKKNNNTNDIINYLKHINNIISNFDIKLEIFIINCKFEINFNEISEYNSIINSYNKLTNFKIYNYSCNYDDSIHNEILSVSNYNSILYTDFDIYLTETFIEWITLNTIQDNTFIRTNIFDLNNIPTQFLETFNNNIYNDILSNLKYITNEQGYNEINSDTYMENFNNNTYINIINSSNIINNKLHYLHYSNKFILTTKNTIQSTGFNIDNIDYNYTFQYVILNFIKNNYSMIKFPFLISCYKLFTEEPIKLLDYNIEFIINTTYNKFINYKVYDIIFNKTSSFIRNKIKTLKGYNPIDTIKQNDILNKTIQHLENKINTYEKSTNNDSNNVELINNESNNNESNNVELINNESNNDILECLKNEIKILKKKNKTLKKNNITLQNFNQNLIQNITDKNINNIILKLHDIELLNKQIQTKINKQKKNIFILQNLKKKFKK